MASAGAVPSREFGLEKGCAEHGPTLYPPLWKSYCLAISIQIDRCSTLWPWPLTFLHRPTFHLSLVTWSADPPITIVVSCFTTVPIWPSWQYIAIDTWQCNILCTGEIKPRSIRSSSSSSRDGADASNARKVGINILALRLLQGEQDSNEKSAQRSENTARVSSKLSPRRRPHFPGALDGKKLISWRWSLPLPTDQVWWGSMHAISSYRGNIPTNTATNPQTDRTDYNTLCRS